ncbi:VWA domain-containing protein [bacterium]|nr:MAG: VWA domain-containing protein [bacterium]
MKSVRAIALGILTGLAVRGLASQPLDVVVMLDESGSMYGNARRGVTAQDPAFLRYAAAQCLVRKLRPGDRLSVVPFGSTALQGSILPFSDPWAGAVDWSPLAQLADAGAAAQLGTNYADALRVATGIFSGPQNDRARLAILLSDGEPNSEGNGVERLELLVDRLKRDAGARLYTLALGSEVKTSLLKSLANRGGGQGFRAERPEELPFVFADIFREAAGREVRTPPDRARFVVGPDARELHAITVGAEGKPGFALIAPDGTRVEPTQEGAVYPKGQTDRVRWLRVERPPAGVWRVEGDPSTLDLAYESSLRARLTAPQSNDAVPNSGDLQVAGQAEGARSGDKLRGTATLTDANGVSIDAKIAFKGDQARVTFTYEDLAVGPASVRFRIWRDLPDGEEEGVPARADFEMIKAKPGVPTVDVQWPGATEMRVNAGERVRMALRFRSTKEAIGKSVRVASGGGWTIEGDPTFKLKERDQTAEVVVRGPYEGARGEFGLSLDAQPVEPALVVQNGSKRMLVRAANLTDIWIILQRIGWPLLALILSFFALAGFGSFTWSLGKRLRRQTLEAIKLEGLKGDVVRKDKPQRSIQRRTFGDKDQDGRMEIDPPAVGQLLTAAIASKGGRPKEIRLSASRLRVPNRPDVKEKVVLGSDMPLGIEIPDSAGGTLKLTASFRYDARLARKIESLRWVCGISLGLLIVTAVVTGLRWTSEMDRSTYRREGVGR